MLFYFRDNLSLLFFYDIIGLVFYLLLVGDCMLVNKKDIDINEALKFADYDKLLLKRRENSMLLNDYQVSVLNRNGIYYNEFTNIRDLLFSIEDCLEDNYDEELDLVGSQIYEFIYYTDTKK